MKPRSEEHAIAADWLNRLPFVRWDRYVESDGDFAVFGWIDREDGRSDFVLVLWETADPLPGAPCYWTSSAARSKEIGELLYGGIEGFDPDSHVDCARVEDDFGGLVENAVVIA